MGTSSSSYRVDATQLSTIRKTKEFSNENYIEFICLGKNWEIIEYFLREFYPIQHQFGWSQLYIATDDSIVVEEYDDFDETVSYHNISTVKKINEELSKVDVSLLREQFFSWNIEGLDLYHFGGINEDEFEYLQKLMIELINFYEAAAKESNFVFVFTGS